LREEGALDERERFIDATVAAAQGGGDGIGKTRRGTGGKILAIVERHGLPRSVSTPRPIIMMARSCHSVSTATCWRPSPSTSLAIVRL